MTDNKIPPSFEESLAELEALVGRMESGEMTLEESLESFEKGVQLTRSCQKALANAEQNVQILLDGEDDGANTRQQ